jgi:hypothetical protein
MILSHTPWHDATERADRSNSVLTQAEAHADRAERAQRLASNCVVMAVVTSSPIAAEMIDQAVEWHRSARSSLI